MTTGGNTGGSAGGQTGAAVPSGFAGMLQPAKPSGAGGSSTQNHSPGPPGPWSGETVDPALTSNPRGAFEGKAAATGAIVVAYPLDGAMHPVNIDDVTVHFSRGAAANNVFKLHFENERGSYDVYAPCTVERCQVPVPAAAWRAIASKNAGAEVRLTIHGSSGAGSVESSRPIAVRFSPENVEGGLYYWSTRLQGFYRLVFGQRKAQPYIVPGGSGNGGSPPVTGLPRPQGQACFGCHAVSRNGARIAWSDLAGRTQIAPTEQPDQRSAISNGSLLTMTLNPSGSLLLVSERGGGLGLYDATNAAPVASFKPASSPASFPGGRGAYFPEWSPDGRSLAVTLSARGEPIQVADGSIAVIPVDANQLGAARVVTTPAAGQLDFYPTWSPDGRWLAFASANAVGRGSYDASTARLRLIATDGGTTHELVAATQGSGIASSWPKFTPFAQRGGRLLFVTFNSKMAYGYALDKGARPQLWLAAIDLDKLAKGEDPSYPPIWLPFQETDQNNHLGYWTEGLGCMESPPSDGYAGCGEGAVCVDGQCIVPPG